MIFDIVSFILGSAAGAVGALLYVHKHTAQAIAVAAKAAADVAVVVADVKKI